MNGTYKFLLVSITAVVLILSAVAYVGSQPPGSDLKRFSSMAELQEFLREKGGSGWPVFYMTRDSSIFAFQFSAEAGAAGYPTKDYSTTNVQVAGVDEADIAKSDGEFLYIASGSAVYIVRAYPPETAGVVAKIKLNDSYSLDLYVNGDRLVVIGSGYSNVVREYDSRMYIRSVAESFIKVYDISDRTSPELVKELTLNGTVIGSRMIGDYVYIVAQKYPYEPYYTGGEKSEVELPSYAFGEITVQIRPEEVYYINSQESYYTFITVIAINVVDDGAQPSHEVFLAGVSSTMYVSSENMYLVAQRSYLYRPMLVAPLFSATEDDWKEETLVYRLSLSNGTVALEAHGTVPGRVLNQYSMDEHNGYFRVATTEWTTNGSKNGVYVMDLDLKIAGSLTDIAPGETIYSARFMGERCYLVTFRQVDPFFVIDLSDPKIPSMLGYLKIPGYSSYLHPFDDGHIIGVGKEGSNLKLSLFDVTDVAHPAEVAKFNLNYSYSDSEVLYDPKAFLFDATRQLLSLPVGWGESKGLWSYYSHGAYVFNLSVEQGFVLKGVIIQESDQTENLWSLTVRRILYIEDALYTVSNEKVCISDADSLDLLASVELR
ncbi:MAG: beta-propeller domain-containing protein [Candidatus Verstraetearchaeota archaeon]|nr:beta-propeller domain-containing protein [Candidatus Verstraetearchaeota archaeon]